MSVTVEAMEAACIRLSNELCAAGSWTHDRLILFVPPSLMSVAREAQSYGGHSNAWEYHPWANEVVEGDEGVIVMEAHNRQRPGQVFRAKARLEEIESE